MAVAADLHVHTTVSDGTLAPDAVPRAARAAGLDAVAVTDHDRLAPVPDAPLVQREGVTVVRGIELRVETGDQRVDLLGYAVEPTDALRTELDRLQADRVARARRMVALVEAELSVTLDIGVAPGVGRPHVARAVADAHPEYDVDRAFAELVGDDGPCYVARDVTGVDRGLELLRDACEVVSLAHPLRYPDPATALSLAPRLDAVEVAYPYDGDPDLAPVERAAAEHGLLATGGSDAHGEALGAAGLDREGWAAVARRLGV